MLDVSEENIVEESEDAGYHEIQDKFDLESKDPVTLVTNQTTPDVIADGIDAIEVTQHADNRYLLFYHGYLVGYLLVTEEGLKEFADNYLADTEDIPNWMLKEDTKTWPDWIPEEYNHEATVECDECGDHVHVTEVVTPGDISSTEPRFCPDCWRMI